MKLDGSDLKLRIQNLSVMYGQRKVLSDISLLIKPGEVAALIGPNGSGKTTLIRAISGVIPIQSGNIFIDGLDIHQLDPLNRSRLLSVIPQARNLPAAFTVEEVVTMGRTPYIGWLGKLSKYDEEIIRAAMLKTDILFLRDRRMGELSGGEQQRVLVARAIAQQSKVMLLDEPTTHLDIQYQIALLEIIRSLAHDDQLVIFMAIHDLNLVTKYADQVIALVDGSVRITGTIDSVLTESILSDIYKVPMRIIEQPGSSGKVIVTFS